MLVDEIFHDKSIGESDHDTVTLRLKIPDRMPIKAQWYYPNNLNKDPEFVEQHIEFLKEKIATSTKMTTKKWDALKNDIKENITKYCKKKKKITKTNIKNFTKN